MSQRVWLVSHTSLTLSGFSRSEQPRAVSEQLNHPHRKSELTMSGAASLSTDLEGGSVANVTFRVRCEPLGHGEEVFLVPDEPQGMEKVSRRDAMRSSRAF